MVEKLNGQSSKYSINKTKCTNPSYKNISSLTEISSIIWRY